MSVVSRARDVVRGGSSDLKFKLLSGAVLGLTG